MKLRNVVSTAVIFAAFSIGLAGETQPADKEIRLPAGAEDDVRVLSANSDGKLLSYYVADKSTSPLKKTFWTFQPQSGKSLDISELVKLQDKKLVITSALVCDDGLNVAVICRPEEGKKSVETAFVINVKTQKVTKLMDSDEFEMSRWVGQRFYMNVVDNPKRATTQPTTQAGEERPRDEMGKIKYYDVASGKTGSLDACGIVTGGSVNGKYLLAICNPDDLANPFTKKDRDKLWIARLSMEGKLLGKVTELKNIHEPPAVSPDGKYIAYNSRVRSEGERKYYMNLFEIASGKELFTVDGRYAILAVSDNGDVIACNTKPVEHGIRKLVAEQFDKNGNATTIAENVSTKVAHQNMLYRLEKTDDGNANPWVIRKLDFVKTTGK